MILNNYHPNHAYDDYIFSVVPFWIQFHGIPINLMFADNIIKVANNIGKVIELRENAIKQIINWKFVHARIEIQVLKPLLVGKLLIRKIQMILLSGSN